MFYKISITSILFLSAATLINAQGGRYIYLGDEMVTRFESGSIIRDSFDYSLIHFLKYQTIRQELLKDTENSIVNRDGIILAAKSTITSSVNAQADFGNTDDSCAILYKTTIQRVRNGRSAALSITNLFSRSGEKVRQPEPSITVQSIQSEGVFSHSGSNNPFFYTSAPKHKSGALGWLELNGDTLDVRPATQQITKRGKVKKAHYYNSPGLLIMKGDGVYAAIEQNQYHQIIYMNRQLAEPDKLVIACYLFIIACYNP